MKVFTTLKFGKIEIENVPFLISEDGKIIMNCETGFVHNPRMDTNGYMRATILQKKRTIHKLVAEAFLGKCPKGMEIDHIDRNKLNNHYKNLRYVTRSEQMKNRDYTEINRLLKIKAELSGAVCRKKIMLKRDTEMVFFDSVKDAIWYIAEREKCSFCGVKYRFYKHMKSDKKICGYEIFYDEEEAQNEEK